jgi:hypothetical protein
MRDVDIEAEEKVVGKQNLLFLADSGTILSGRYFDVTRAKHFNIKPFDSAGNTFNVLTFAV